MTRIQTSGVYRAAAWIFALLLVTSLSGQTAHKPRPAASSPATLTAISAEGSQRYTSSEIIAAIGLELGQNASEDDFKLASQHLGETGVFSDVAYSFQSSPAGTRLEFKVTDASGFVPARFENFVWFSAAGLHEKVHARVPLFTDQVPESGNLVDQISDALQALLIENNIQGRADYIRATGADNSIEAFVFTVIANSIRIHGTEFEGASDPELPLLQAAAKGLVGKDYLRSALSVQSDKNFLPIYRARGYLKASVSEAQPKVIQSTPEETLVDVNFSVVPGSQYKLSGIGWAGNTQFSNDKLQPLIRLTTGQPADTVLLDENLKDVQKLYGTRGYLDTVLTSVPRMDDAQSTVSYLIQVSEGETYKMGEFEVQGLDDHATAQLVELWGLRSGDAYDSSYAERFLRDTAKSIAPAEKWNADIHELPDKQSKTVDVTLRFSSRNAQ